MILDFPTDPYKSTITKEEIIAMDEETTQAAQPLDKTPVQMALTIQGEALEALAKSVSDLRIKLASALSQPDSPDGGSEPTEKKAEHSSQLTVKLCTNNIAIDNIIAEVRAIGGLLDL